ncbi:hypothetical protein [Sorangium sp. So ce1335]|uniref:hypothetical protein n=1 Tax=Sorangium sp. So ce1335 TaxID=3133335 RepID=UPI003F622CBA
MSCTDGMVKVGPRAPDGELETTRAPSDRILVAHAGIEHLQIVTADRIMTPYDVRLTWADSLAALGAAPCGTLAGP